MTPALECILHQRAPVSLIAVTAFYPYAHIQTAIFRIGIQSGPSYDGVTHIHHQTRRKFILKLVTIVSFLASQGPKVST